MADWNKFLALGENHDWLMKVFICSKKPDDKRSIKWRFEQSVAFVTLQEFGEVDLSWAAQGSWQPLFNHKGYSETGVFNQCRPILVTKYARQPEQFRLQTNLILPSLGEQNCTVAAVMRDALRTAKERPDMEPTFVAVVLQQLVFASLHRTTSESFHIYLFPERYDASDLLTSEDIPSWVPALGHESRQKRMS